MNLSKTCASVVLCVLTLGAAYAAVTEDQEKRDERKRLLGNPDTWGAEIAALQDKVRALQSKLHDLESRKIGTVTAQQIQREKLSAVYLASSDLTHYGPNYGFTPVGIGESALQWAMDNDRRLLNRVQRMEIEQIVPEAHSRWP